VKNTGSVAGKEVVMLFSKQLYASITPDVKRLRRFEKINLEPGEAKTLTFVLPIKELGFINLNNKKVVEAGEYEIQMGRMTTGFTVRETTEF
ncbi:MAG: fibronectin type III-like domain-contianing protein, partial [Pedobacter sp.]|nr:fibronectin type III-like domain-contianing protein [Pedobacter sp.]